MGSGNHVDAPVMRKDRKVMTFLTHHIPGLGLRYFTFRLRDLHRGNDCEIRVRNKLRTVAVWAKPATGHQLLIIQGKIFRGARRRAKLTRNQLTRRRRLMLVSLKRLDQQVDPQDGPSNGCRSSCRSTGPRPVDASSVKGL